MEVNSTSEVDKEKNSGPRLDLDDSGNKEFDEGNNETELMLKDEDRRESDPGIQPTPMAHASFFSKYISFW